MYVKVVPLRAGTPPRELSDTATILTVAPDPTSGQARIETGRLFFTENPSDDWVKALGIETGDWWLEQLDDGDGPTSTWDDGKTGGSCWDLRYARWWEYTPDGRMVQHWVVTGGRIFILGDNGKTIDSVN